MDNNQDDKSGASFLKIFEEGKNFTEKLLKENERLRLVVAGLRNEVRGMENRYVKVDVPHLQEKIHLLEEEIRLLRTEIKEQHEQYSAIEEENYEFAERYIEVERQNSNLINLYVASYRLHSTLDYRKVIDIVKEIVINMIGSEQFQIYLVDGENQHLMLIAHEGDPPEVTDFRIEDDELGKCIQSGQPCVPEAGGDSETGKDLPAAVIPLKVGDRVMGIIVIEKLLIQKDGFQAIDHELFELLGGHAATAIYGSHLYSMSERKRNTLEGFLELLKQDLIENRKAV